MPGDGWDNASSRGRDDLLRFYGILGRLEGECGGTRTPSRSDGLGSEKSEQHSGRQLGGRISPEKSLAFKVVSVHQSR
jgi:hypothetical protein